MKRPRVFWGTENRKWCVLFLPPGRPRIVADAETWGEAIITAFKIFHAHRLCEDLA